MVENDFAVIMDFYLKSNVTAGVSNKNLSRSTFHMHS